MCVPWFPPPATLAVSIPETMYVEHVAQRPVYDQMSATSPSFM